MGRGPFNPFATDVDYTRRRSSAPPGPEYLRLVSISGPMTCIIVIDEPLSTAQPNFRKPPPAARECTNLTLLDVIGLDDYTRYWAGQGIQQCLELEKRELLVGVVGVVDDLGVVDGEHHIVEEEVVEEEEEEVVDLLEPTEQVLHLDQLLLKLQINYQQNRNDFLFFNAYLFHLEQLVVLQQLLHLEQLVVLQQLLHLEQLVVLQQLLHLE